MSDKTKKPRQIKVAGVSCINGTYKLNVSGRTEKLQLFQVATKGHTEFRFVHLPHVMSKLDAMKHLVQHITQVGMVEFLRGKIAQAEAELNKVPGKRGRPKGSKNKAKKTVEKPVKQVIVEIKPKVKPVKATAPVVEKKKAMDDIRAQLRAAKQKLAGVA